MQGQQVFNVLLVWETRTFEEGLDWNSLHPHQFIKCCDWGVKTVFAKFVLPETIVTDNGTSSWAKNLSCSWRATVLTTKHLSHTTQHPIEWQNEHYKLWTRTETRDLGSLNCQLAKILMAYSISSPGYNWHLTFRTSDGRRQSWMDFLSQIQCHSMCYWMVAERNGVIKIS